MRRWIGVAGAVALVAVACAPQSTVDPNATVHVTGQAYAVGGAPLGDRPVKLGAGVPGSDGAVAAFSGGLLCATGICTGPVRNGSTDAAGHYDLAVKGSDTQGALGAARSELLTVSAPPTGQQVSGASASARFYIQTTAVTVPALRLVDPSLVVAGATALLTAAWRPTSPPADTLTFVDRDGSPVWSVPVHGMAAALDGRVLEATQGRAVLSGGASDAITGSQVSLRWTGPGVAYASGSGTPVSRGRPCAFARAGVAAVDTETACGLTDGDLVATVPPEIVCATPATRTAPASDCAFADEVTVALATPLPADLVVVRGCTGTCPVSVSADGRAFAGAGAVSGDDATLVLPGTPVVAVRLGGLTTADLAEISIWAPQRAAALAPVGDRLSGVLRAPFLPSHGHRTHTVLVASAGAVAALALAGVLVGLGITLGRRRRAPG